MVPASAAWRVLPAVVALLLLPAPAAAHGDGPGHGDDALKLGPGGHQAYPVEVHWHRVVGTLRASDPPEGQAEVLVLDEPAYAAFQAGVPFEPTIRAGPASSLRLNALIRCCADATWTPYHVIVRNAGDQAATFEVQLQTVHDDAGVAFTATESGGVPVIELLIFGGAAVVLGRRVRSPIRARAPARTEPSGAASPSDPAIRAGLAGAVVLTLLVSLTVAGSWAFGGSPIEAAVAGLALVPFPDNGVVGRAGALLGLGLIGTLATLHFWTRALQARQGDASPRLLALGASAGTAMMAALVLGVATYGPQALVGGIVLTLPLTLVVVVGIGAAVRKTPPSPFG